ncbi:MAG: tRNA preQ1(34) S-adenosylmethionine ribosyltransferase-isomerase QueA [Elusimicrobia bacterium]|nr:tRNA preQ1(34) S-adenosylmethionine ribosyltransferase-isomerase QueA [Elusimicrobiota bacterium]
MRLSDFDFEYPEAQIAAEPADPRDSARLMVVRRPSGGKAASWEHRIFRDLPGLLEPGDCLVLNRTKVFPARLLGKKSTGGKADLLLVHELEPDLWAVLSSGLKTGMKLVFPGGLRATVEGLDDEGEYLCRFDRRGLMGFAESHGMAPLPPYIRKARRALRSHGAAEDAASAADLARYQTVYAREPGSIAAPTAGLHFTPAVFAALEARGVKTAWVTLHVGRGTFRPIEHDDPRSHRMLPEWYRMEEVDAVAVRAAKAEGRRVVAVGTTSTRTIETVARGPGSSSPAEGWTDLYIHPGHEFKAVTGLVTNFHLPRSTPLLLASAFLGRVDLMAAYRDAIGRGYRLFSFGDAMIIL